MKAPITYTPDFIEQNTGTKPAYFFGALWNDLDWKRIDGTPRREYYVNLKDGSPYTYGRGAGVRTYQSQACSGPLLELWLRLETILKLRFDVCFLNGYEDSRDHLGWHADDSPEMDDARPIAIVSLGAEREIWFRETPKEVKLGPGVISMDNGIRHRVTGLTVNVSPGEPEKLLLQNGSLCLMHPGMQDTHQHRIPKASRVVGPRVSLTFRGLVS